MSSSHSLTTDMVSQPGELLFSSTTDDNENADETSILLTDQVPLSETETLVPSLPKSPHSMVPSSPESYHSLIQSSRESSLPLVPSTPESPYNLVPSTPELLSNQECTDLDHKTPADIIYDSILALIGKGFVGILGAVVVLVVLIESLMVPRNAE